MNRYSTGTVESWELGRQLPKMADNMNVCVQNAQPCLPRQGLPSVIQGLLQERI